MPRPIPTDPELAAAANKPRDSIFRHLTYVGAAPRGAKRKVQQLVEKAAAAGRLTRPRLPRLLLTSPPPSPR